jgi:hypothetical protein
VGRIVHFYAPKDEDPDGEPFAAIVTGIALDVGEECVDLVTFGRGSLYFHFMVSPAHLAGEGEGYWEWPPRAEGGGK